MAARSNPFMAAGFISNGWNFPMATSSKDWKFYGAGRDAMRRWR